MYFEDVQHVTVNEQNVARLTPAIVAVTVVCLALGQGGYFPVAWGWSAAVLGWLALAGLAAARLELCGIERITLWSWFALTAWTGASIAWSADISASVQSLELAGVYLTALTAMLVIGRRASASGLLIAIWASITAVSAYALLTHLSPLRFGLYIDPIQKGRLFQPIGYANGLGIFTAMGLLLALGFCAGRGRSRLQVCVAGSVPLLAVTLFFTFSRGAAMAAAFAWLGVAALSPARLRYIAVSLVLAPGAAIVVWRAWESQALTAAQVEVMRASGAGERLAVVLCLCMAASAGAMAAWQAVEARWTAGPWIRRGFALALAAAAGAAMIAGLAAFGSPREIATRVHAGLVSQPVAQASLGARLSTLSLDGRKELWGVAVDDYRAHSLLGSGAGSYRRAWYAHRDTEFDVRDAHSLYLQVLAELGPVGLALVIAALGCPLAAAVRLRGDPVVVPAVGAYLAFVMHAAVDWDWQLPAVTVAALGCGAAVLLRARVAGRSWRFEPAMLSAMLCAAIVVALVGLAGNLQMSRARSALVAGHPAAAVARARSAATWMPWSSQPLVLEGLAFGRLRQPVRARAAYGAAAGKDAGAEDAWGGLLHVGSAAQRRHALAVLRRLDPLGW